jgi:SAM-dependent methyltransferase
MLSRLFILLCRFAPLKTLLWKNWYNFLTGHHQEGGWTFMNYGYVPAPGDPPLVLKLEDEPDRYCIQLYHRVASQADIQGKRVLEIGSGRGGGASYVKRYLSPDTLTGVDFSDRAIAFCRRRHAMEGLSFEEGSAEALPFKDSTFDAVLNVESSHCYASMDTFLNEVQRVLRPGGFFLHADFRDSASLGQWQQELKNSGMRILSGIDITGNVLAALDADNDRKSALIRKYIPRPLLASFEDFAGMRGSAVYNGFRSGRLVYMVFLLERPTGS